MDEDRFFTEKKHIFHLLDGVRGVAALVIVQRHTAWLFGTDAWPGTYLSVDLFFVLSGFVIAHAYERKLAGGWSWRSFMAVRLIRLYPLYLLGVFLGLVALAGHMAQAPTAQGGAPVFLQAAFSAILMLPNWGLPPLIGARWSLTYEILANAIYALIISVLSNKMLIGIIAVSGLSFGLLIVHGTPIDTGWQYDQAPMALARVGYSFFVGLLLYRIYIGLAGLRMLLLLGLAAAAVWAGIWILSVSSTSMIEVTLVLFVFPTLTLFAARLELYGVAAYVCGLFGTLSYPIYVLHQPASLLFEAALRRLVGPDTKITPYAGWLFVVIFVVACSLIDAVYDKRVRARLRRWLNRPEQRVDFKAS